MKAIRNLLLLIASLTFALIAAEFAVRYIYHDITSTATMNSWFGLRWANENIVRNDRGMRERNFSNEKAPGTYRIAILGDSFSVGQGIDVNLRYSARLESLLHEDGIDAEVLNFSSPGQNTEDQLEVLEQMVLQTNPDFVLLQWLPNDFRSDDIVRFETAGVITPFPAAEKYLQYRSALYYVVRAQWVRRQIANGEVPSYPEQLHEAAREGSPGYTNARNSLASIATVTKEHEIGFGAILMPLLTEDLASDYTYADLHTTALGWCNELEAECIDMQPLLAQELPAAGVTGWWVNEFDPHPNAQLHNIVAQHAAELFGPAFRSVSRDSPDKH